MGSQRNRRTMTEATVIFHDWIQDAGLKDSFQQLTNATPFIHCLEILRNHRVRIYSRRLESREYSVLPRLCVCVCVRLCVCMS